MLRPAELLVPLGAALLMLLVLGPTPRGAAGGLLAAAALLAVRFRSAAGGRPAEQPALRLIERVQVGPRVTVALVETGGRRYLIVAGGSVTPLRLEGPG